MNIRDAQNFSDQVIAALTEERKKQGLSQYELAERSGLSEAAISYIERFERRPTIYTLKMLADALGIKTFELLKRVED